MKTSVRISLLAVLIVFSLAALSCKTQDRKKSAGEETEVSGDDVVVATYYFPNWGPFEDSEWKRVKEAKPRFEGHQHPKVPLWGYTNENEPYGWSGSKYLYMALEDGFLHAPNNNRMKFSLMWCNHDLQYDHKGAVRPETFESLTDYVIENYFSHPSYWLIDGCPYFSIYQMNSFLETFGNDYSKAAEAMQKFREKVKAAGFPDLHLNAVLWGGKR